MASAGARASNPYGLGSGRNVPDSEPRLRIEDCKHWDLWYLYTAHDPKKTYAICRDHPDIEPKPLNKDRRVVFTNTKIVLGRNQGGESWANDATLATSLMATFSSTTNAVKVGQ
jgi:hypothetical protein